MQLKQTDQPRPSPQVQQYVVRIFLGLLAALLVVKLVLRPWVLAREIWSVIDVFVLSFPSFVEAVVIVTIVFGILSLAKHYSVLYLADISNRLLLAGSVLMVGAYVLTQELMSNNLGGLNVVDPWDVADL